MSKRKAKIQRRREGVANRMFARMAYHCEVAGVPVLCTWVFPDRRRLYEIVFKCKEWFNTQIDGQSPRALAREAMQFIRGEK